MWFCCEVVLRCAKLLTLVLMLDYNMFETIDCYYDYDDYYDYDNDYDYG